MRYVTPLLSRLKSAGYMLVSSQANRRVQKAKRSDTLIVLGSGASINRIDDWKFVERHDSFGFNFFMVHDHVPTFYSVEPPISLDFHRSMCRLIELKGPEYWKRTLPMVKVENDHNGVMDAFQTMDIAADWLPGFGVAATSPKSLRTRLQWLDKQRWLKNVLGFWGQGVASVEGIAFLGFRLGYKHIVLAGIDITDPMYFFQDPSYGHIRDSGILLPAGIEGTVHLTGDSLRLPEELTVQEVLKVYRDYFMEFGVHLYVENPNSALANILPVWKL